MPNRILCEVILALLTGCVTVGPDYQRPAIDTPAAWRFEEKEVRDLANTAWWQQFNDPVLNGLVSTALEQNKDLLIATAHVEKFFGRYFSTRRDQFLSAGGTAGGYLYDRHEKNK
jgi:multidrug efflux system outer membrane protein